MRGNRLRRAVAGGRLPVHSISSSLPPRSFCCYVVRCQWCIPSGVFSCDFRPGPRVPAFLCREGPEEPTGGRSGQKPCGVPEPSAGRPSGARKGVSEAVLDESVGGGWIGHDARAFRARALRATCSETTRETSASLEPVIRAMSAVVWRPSSQRRRVISGVEVTPPPPACRSSHPSARAAGEAARRSSAHQ